jgi:hypothetical protein
MPPGWMRSFATFAGVTLELKEIEELPQPESWWAHRPTLPPDAPDERWVDLYGPDGM